MPSENLICSLVMGILVFAVSVYEVGHLVKIPQLQLWESAATVQQHAAWALSLLFFLL